MSPEEIKNLLNERDFIKRLKNRSIYTEIRNYIYSNTNEKEIEELGIEKRSLIFLEFFRKELINSQDDAKADFFKNIILMGYESVLQNMIDKKFANS